MAESKGHGPRWFDSHCHLQDRYVEEAGFEAAASSPLAEVLGACAVAGVDRLVCVGTDPQSSRQALDLARRSAEGSFLPEAPEVFATVGLHPHEAARGVEETAVLVEKAVVHGPTPVAIGECGLDYHYDHAPRGLQRQAFAAQLALAHAHGLALVVHAREAFDDLFDIARAEGVPERAVLHCFTGGPEEARRGLDLGFHLSFSGVVTFKGAEEVRRAASVCPLDRLLVETDSPFLAPVPHRGRPNQPSLVPFVGRAVAATKGVAEEVVAEASWRAATALFALADR